MIRRNISEMEGTPVEVDGAKGVTMKLLAGKDDGAPTFAMRHFLVEPGGFTPKHEHPWEHEVLVIAGDGELECGSEVISIHAGDGLFIPGDTLHQFRNTSENSMEFLCIVPVESPCGQCVPGS